MLSRGVINRIIHGEEIHDPILHVQECKAMTAGNEATSRYKLSLSDGVSTIAGMLTQQMNFHVIDGSLTTNKLIKLTQFMCNDMANTKILILVNIEIVGNADAGAMPQAAAAPSYRPQTSVPSYAAPAPPQSAVPSYGSSVFGDVNPPTYSAPPSYGASAPTVGYGAPPAAVSSYGAPPAASGYGASAYGKAIVRDDSNAMITPIRDINPYSNKWTIKARVTRKADIKRWSNAKGEGTLFSIDLLDSQGTEIRATFFKEACDKFYPLIEEGKAYCFSGGKLKVVTNTQYTTFKNNYELTFDVTSDIRPALDDDSIKKATFKFVKISQIGALETNAVCDVIGIVRQAGEVSEIVSTKYGNKTLYKRDLSLYDDSNTEVRVTVWGDKAQDPSIPWENSIIAFKGVKVGDYQGKNLGTMNSTQILVMPAIQEGYALDSWRKSNASAVSNLASLSTSTSGDTRGADPLEKRKLIANIREEGLGHGEKGDYVSFKGTVTFITKSDKDPWYNACPKCSKKVVEVGNEIYRCERCDSESSTCDQRYILNYTVTDSSGQQWMTSFNDTGELIVGRTAKELYTVKTELGTDAMNALCSEALFKTYLMRARVKYEQVNDTQRLKYTVLRADPVDWRAESLQIIDAINKY